MCKSTAAARWLLAFTAALFGTSQNAGAQIKPRLNEATLEMAGKTLKPVQVRSPWTPLSYVGQREFTCRDDAVMELNAKTGESLWSVKSANGERLQWLASDANTAFLGIVPKEREAPTARILRLDLAGQKWLPPLEPLWAGKQADQVESVVGVEPGPTQVAVLTRTWQKNADPEGWLPASHTIAVYAKEMERPLWTKTVKAGGERPSPGVFMWGVPGPEAARSAVRPLSWMGEDLVLCAGEKENIVCFDAKGSTKWEIPRVWEFERGFIGPSVWSHFIGRFGKERSGMEPDAAASKAAQDAFDKQYECAIVGGPIVMPVRYRQDADHRSIFVAVSKAPSGWDHLYRAECIVYEINSGGEIQRMSTLPRMVEGSNVGITYDAIHWACQKGAMARIRQADKEGGGMGVDDDCLCLVDWYREIHAPELRGWLRTAKSTAEFAFADRFALGTLEGGTITADKHEFQFPITLTELRTGMDDTAILHVPFDGEPAAPTTNYTGTADGTIVTLNPYLLGVTGMGLHGSTLEVRVGGEESATGLMFDVKMLDDLRLGTATAPAH